MPNHCQNRLIVEGPAEDIARFREQAAEQVNAKGERATFTIESFVPEPPPGDPRRIPSDTHQDGWDWYQWRCDNWGSKWDVYRQELQESAPERLVYRFKSAWAPPIEGIRRIAIAYPALTLDLVYMEAGMQFYGHVKFRDETELEREQREYQDEVERDDEGEVTAINDPILKAHVETHDFDFFA